ncbi:hypothetical protein R1flu_012385 [Riccia fluitans]|uniref:Glycosyltransferase n=1 Tax=Riccia fluitans TaxID=41844 RepID=A0ABD1ZAP4_9MARC
MGLEVNPNATVWFVALPFFTHLKATSQLAEILAGRGLTVTLLGSKHDIQRLQASWGHIPESSNKRNIQFRSLDIELPDLGNTVGGNARLLKPFAQAELAFEEVLKSELARGSRPTCVIVDLFMPGARDLAAGAGIPAWPFLPFLSSFLTTNLYLKKLGAAGILTLPDSLEESDVKEEFINIPGLSLMKIYEVNAIYFKCNPLYRLGQRRADFLQEADVLIMTGFRELEPQAFSALEKLLYFNALQNSRKISKIWTVGPMFPLLSDNQVSVAKELVAEKVDPCIRFLDSQSPSSVVYVSFGTDVSVSQEQLLELVYGLESSQQPFICALRTPKSDQNSYVMVQDLLSDLDPALLSRISRRSLFVEWAPQMDVLSHASTGAFLSHCGFNSLLESVWHGVPILGWPRQYDQFTNCRHLVDEAQIALEVHPRLIPDGFVTRKDVEIVITTLFHTAEGKALRERARQMKQQAEESVGENGSSSKNLETLVAHIEHLAKQTSGSSNPKQST